MLADYTSPFESTVVERLRNAGADIVGKTNMDEFGMGSHSMFSHFGPVLNPLGFAHDPSGRLTGPPVQRISPGGSSGGAAVSVASGEADLAIASDTGGSTRLPAAWCGVLGFKPSYGLVSRWGMVQYATSLDCVGLISNEASTIRRGFAALEGFDSRDPTSIPLDTRARAADLHASFPRRSSTSTPLDGLRVGIPLQAFPAALSPSVLPAVRRVLSHLRSQGAELKPVSLPGMGDTALSAYYVPASAEAASNLAKYDGVRYGFRAEEDVPSPNTPHKLPSRMYAATRTQGFGEEVKRRILLGNYALTAEAFDNFFLQAQKVRLLLRREFDATFRVPSPLAHPGKPTRAKPEGVDVLVLPTALSPAPLLRSSESLDTSARAKAVRDAWAQDVLLVPASLGGLPAASVPVWPVLSASNDRQLAHQAGTTAEGSQTSNNSQPRRNRRPEAWTGTEGEERRPVGVQLVAQWGGDATVLDVAEAIMQM